MFFFKIEISSFDDASKTLFIVPEQHTDEQGVPFEDKMLTQTADFKQFVKSTQTCMVDGKYTQYKTDLNGENNGGIVGADGKYKAHRIVYCLVDNANGYAVVGGEKVRSISKRMVLSVPADSGLTVDGVLSVLNAAGSGFDNWERSENKNGGYPYPSKITF